ncbi:histidinol-phosphate transaminase [Serratia sp. UGAL515B_01]|uniref:histidinol-phosphate transaminase n=1 Tax=Serratia sp. UGAL515B_01 TaxID=2986763 RepID=UPI0029534274|nr:histidinol-phosphate transaminase [Serratia sp. UGAL515B_01]WON78453.1 histidinol-phosphate transaminase [Serratia sp. UGAL515B_01]
MYASNTFARTEVQALNGYNAGLSIEAVQERHGVLRVAKLGSNENPLGISPKALAALTAEAHQAALYPNQSCGILRNALAHKLAIDGKNLVFGNGSEDLLSIICRVFLDHGDQVVTILPSFGLHIIYPQAAGAEVIGVPMGSDMRVDVQALMAAMTPRTRLLMFSSPSNPVGSALNSAELQYVIDNLPPHTLLVFDEAYFEYANGEADYPDCLEMLQKSQCHYIVLRTFSKAYALAGLRIGYGITSDPALAELIDRLRTPFNVNRCAQAAATAALADNEHLIASIQHVRSERSRINKVLQQDLGLQPIPSLANFIFFSSPLAVDSVNLSLLQQGVITKPWAEAGYRQFLRVSIGSCEDNNLFLQALENALHQ